MLMPAASYYCMHRIFSFHRRILLYLMGLSRALPVLPTNTLPLPAKIYRRPRHFRQCHVIFSSLGKKYGLGPGIRVYCTVNSHRTSYVNVPLSTLEDAVPHRGCTSWPASALNDDVDVDQSQRTTANRVQQIIIGGRCYRPIEIDRERSGSLPLHPATSTFTSFLIIK